MRYYIEGQDYVIKTCEDNRLGSFETYEDAVEAVGQIKNAVPVLSGKYFNPNKDNQDRMAEERKKSNEIVKRQYRLFRK